MQPRELYKMMDAYRKRNKDADRKRAYLTTWIVNPHLKEPVKPDDIFNPMYYSAEEIEKMKQEKAKSDLEYFESFKEKG